MLDNKLSSEGIPYSRYIASWRKTGRQISYRRCPESGFWGWLKSRGLSDDECWGIINLGTTGKLELEDDARKYIKEHFL